MIEVVHLSKSYGRHRALDSVSFLIDKGTIAGFLGPNGAGKTTTMRILTAFTRPDPQTGSVTVAGVDVLKSPQVACSRIGYLPEGVPLPGELRVIEYLRHRADLKRVGKRKAREVSRVVAECDLEQVSSRLVGTLSKGFRQRVGLADALLGDPEVLILDEPTSGLDPRQATEVRSLISSLAGRRTVLLSSHIIGEVEQVCDRVVILAGGKVRLDESRRGWQRRLQDSGSLTIEVADPPADIKKQLRSLPDILSVSGGSGVFQLRCRGDQREGILRAATEAHWRVLELRSDLVSLESVFLESTGEPIEGKDHDG